MNPRQKIAALLAERQAGRMASNVTPRAPTMNPQMHMQSGAPKLPSSPLPAQTNFLPMPKEPGINKPLRFGAIKQKLGKI
jgi:hypothetical protein